MTAAVGRPRVRWYRWILALVCVVVIVIGAVVFLVVRSIPNDRIAFLIDTSAAGTTGAVADAVGAAVQNTGDGDALSLRRFGGRCGDPHNTAQVVGAGAGHAARISRAVHHLAPTGVATLESGILAAINDFAGRYPFRGRKSNRIIVVTGRGADACARDQAAVKKALQDKVDTAGLRLDFRFVSYLTPTSEQGNLTQLASAVRSPSPDSARTPAELAATLKRLVVPHPPEAVPMKVPTSTPPAAGGPGAVCGDAGPSPTGGTLRLVIKSGNVTCAEARKVLDAYRASRDRQGSGGFATVDGWNCAHNSIAGFRQDKVYLGCERASDAFQTLSG